MDLAFGVLYLVDLLFGHPIERLSRFIDLDGELNLPTWYASIQWFCVAVVLWMVAIWLVRRSRPATWVLFVLPAVFLLFSLDEVAALHEGFGGVLDRLVLDVPRSQSPLPKTGVLVVLFGIPFAVAMATLFIVLRPLLRDFRGGFLMLAWGMAAVAAGSIGAEVLSNFTVPSSLLEGVQVLTEEMLELVGSTLVLWGAYVVGRDSGAISRVFGSPQT